ncbi:MAG: hypothetical protein EPO00_10505 [Chloroflexota bacterium]|nr:MAG: hypothetical protein EPO00_10505 [Chloroflexota bacterium]
MPDVPTASNHAPAVTRPRPSIMSRLPGLLAGLVIFGFGIALMARAGIGLGPWEAFHQGIQFRTGIPMGTISILLGLPILALWWPLGERPGIGTLVNVLLIGSATNVGNAVLPTQTVPVLQFIQMAAGVVVIGIGSGLYLAADLGPGPRDGLMVGVHHRFRWSIRRARTAIELAVLVAGWALGGTIGIGTVVFAFGIGPVVQVMLGVFDRDGRIARGRAVRVLGGAPGSVGE